MKKFLLTALFYSLIWHTHSQFSYGIGTSYTSTNYEFESQDLEGISYTQTGKDNLVGLAINAEYNLFNFGNETNILINLEFNSYLWNYGFNSFWFNPNIGLNVAKNFNKAKLYLPVNFGAFSFGHEDTGWNRETNLNIISGLGFRYGDLFQFYSEVLYGLQFNNELVNPLRVNIGIRWRYVKKYK
jgi:hypothetical protein